MNILTGVEAGGYVSEILPAQRDIPINTECNKEAIRLECLINPRPAGVGLPGPSSLFRIEGKTAVGSAAVWHTYSHIIFAHL